MDLYLLRHGIPVEPEHWRGPENTRPLTAEGRVQARAVVQVLKNSGKLAVGQIWTSPYARTEETARIASEILGAPCGTSRALASGASLIDTLPRLHGSPDTWPTSLLCVGHMPDLGVLISTLMGTRLGSHGLGRAAIAKLTGRFAPSGMQLEWLLEARQVLTGPS